ncbi:lysosomal Pro-X carboxypeptidase-like [Rhodamnia argentea]|uniref:Lysosomal Pro-X carboxypeptidase-like n=1 Tax=Rhodamnia argentea TaxID=178133 RepID=A0A8B8NIK6_9MYRT|nr:lysosomal Pro-X carboxypeptidase-like [Rhodamnia argentea]
MTLSRLSFIISFILSTASISGQKIYSPTLSLQREDIFGDPEHAVSASIANEFETFFFNQTLDHFNYRPESYATFKQRYLINSNYWAGANSSAPIFVYLGAESPIDGATTIIGFLTDNAAQFKALLVYIEHRYYGESIPLGMSFEEALGDANVRGYFSSAQALADYAAIILHVKQNLKARDSPVIVVGGSYGGMLASWFRLKYPHVALGALASSAPILYFEDMTPQDAYYSVVTKDFKEASETCYQTIRDSWSEIDRVAQEPNGTSNLSKMFKTCKPLESGDEVKSYLKLLYARAAQYNDPPRYPVTQICSGIDGANTSENGILGKIFAGVVAYNGSSTCYVNPPTNVSQTSLGWRWQRCSEMAMPIGITSNSMFQPQPFILSNFTDGCNYQFGVVPRAHWVTTYYGGHDIELILRRFGSNIIFSNGLRDPWSTAGVLKNISESIVAIFTEKGSHCLDILVEKQTDPDWLVLQRKAEVEIIKGWIAKYYADLLAFKQ